MNIKALLLATRPKTLPASIIPVAIGSSLAYKFSIFNLPIFLLIMLCTLLIQIITNYINEIYDFKKGADTEERLGPKRHVATGDISPKQMKIISSILIILCFSLGLLIVDYSGIEILFVGIISLVFAWGYTGGPYPLAYNGLGELFVLVFFGLVAVSGTYYVYSNELTLFSILAGISPGLLSVNILAVNNLRDINTDPKANKITLAVKVGEMWAKRLYSISNALAYLSVVIIAFLVDSYYILLPLLTIPISIKLVKGVYTQKGKDLNKVLEGTAKLLLLFGLLFIIGIMLI